MAKHVKIPGRVAALCGALLALLAFAAPACRAQDRLASAALEHIADSEKRLPEVRDDYEKLLALRSEMEPFRDRLRARLAELEPLRTELQQKLAQLGPAPAGGESPDLAAQRSRLTEAQGAFEAEYRPVVVALQQSDQYWDKLTQMRRDLFSSRLLMHVESCFDPGFWVDFARFEAPRFAERASLLRKRWAAYVAAHDNRGTGLGLGLSAVLVVAFFLWSHRIIARRQRLSEAEGAEVSESEAIRRGAILFVMRTAPLACAMLLLNMAIRRLDVAPDDVDGFLGHVAIGLFVIGAARGAMGALLSPHAPRWRIARASDAQADILYRMVVIAIDLYTVGIVFSSFQRLIEARVNIQIATIDALTAAMIALAFWGLRKLDAAEESPVNGFVSINLGWTRPLVALAAIVCAGALAFGYVALAGFLSGRVVISAAVIAIALLMVTLLDQVLEKNKPSESPVGQALCRSMGLAGPTLDLAGAAISGSLRFLVIVTAGLIVLMPWGLEYGDVNPFADFSNFITTSDLRKWLGSFGFALLAFVVGLIATRLVVGWIDGSLLPRTRLDWSLRHSVRTVFGYVGFAATALVALSLMGINAQNVAVVAGALSVGIGFGLQSIVSNFVSGLIVLAERPVRVGDTIVVKGEEGTVEHISVRSTRISTFERSSLIVPNSDLISSIVRNRTLTDSTQLLRLTLLLAHESDPEEVRFLAMDIMTSQANVMTTPPPRVLLMRVTELGQEFEMRACIDNIGNMLQVRSDLHDRFVRTFRIKGVKFARLPGASA